MRTSWHSPVPSVKRQLASGREATASFLASLRCVSCMITQMLDVRLAPSFRPVYRSVFLRIDRRSLLKCFFVWISTSTLRGSILGIRVPSRYRRNISTLTFSVGEQSTVSEGKLDAPLPVCVPIHRAQAYCGE